MMARKSTIYICAAVPLKDAYLGARMSCVRRMARKVRKRALLALWQATGRLKADRWELSNTAFSNRGDIALAAATRQHLTGALGEDQVELREIGWHELRSPMLDTVNEQGDAVVLAGGGFIMFEDRQSLTELCVDRLAAISSIKVPVISHGIGVNLPGVQSGIGNESSYHDPDFLEPDRASRRALQQLSGQLTGGTVRDPWAYALLKSYQAPIRQGVDPAFFLEPANSVETAPREGGSSPRIGINLAVHCDQQFEHVKLHIDSYISAFRRIQQDTGCLYLGFVHSDEEHFIYAMLRSAGLSIEIIDEDLGATMEAYRSLDAHICQMMHSSILATSVGIPTLNIAYDIKNMMFFDQMGLSEYCLQTPSVCADELTARFAALWSNRRQIRQHLLDRKEHLRPTHEAQLALLANLAPSACSGAPA